MAAQGGASSKGAHAQRRPLAIAAAGGVAALLLVWFTWANLRWRGSTDRYPLPPPPQSQPRAAPARRTALLIATHKWTRSVAEGMLPFMASAHRCGLDVHVLLAAPPSAAFEPLPPRPRDLPPYATWTAVAAADVRALYASGFVDHSRSNHWNLMWWWRAVGRPGEYDAVWSLEYDVRAVGNVDALWGAPSPTADFVSTVAARPLEPVFTHFFTREMEAELHGATRVCAWKQVFRASERVLDAWDAAFARGANGCDEAVLTSLAYSGGYELDDVARFIDAPSWLGGLMPWAKQQWERHAAAAAARATAPTANALTLYHPIKD